MNNITQKRLKELLHYDPETGVFKWIKSGKGRSLHNQPGCLNDKRYRIIYISYKIYRAHRLAWLYYYGSFPENELDHINRNTSDNRIENLREVSHMCNLRNAGEWKNNTSGVKGVTWNKIDKRWRSQISINSKVIQLGSHAEFAEAACARLAMEQCLGWSGCDSSSPAFKYVQDMFQNKGEQRWKEQMLKD
jgi:hypothetical protein